MRTRFILLGAVAIAVSAFPADAGVIRGKLLLTPAAVHADQIKDPAALARAERGVTDAVVYLEQVPDHVERKLTGHGWLFFIPRPAPMPKIIQADMRFKPRITPVAVGTSVRLENRDRVYHSAFSVSAAKRFDLGKYPPGTIDTILFDHAGVVNLHCEIHPEMMGYIVVVPNHAYVRPDSLGGFQLPKLPAGRYTVRAWHPTFGELTKQIEVPRHGDGIARLVY